MKKLRLFAIYLLLTVLLLSACGAHETDPSESLQGSVYTTSQTPNSETSQSEEITEDTQSLHEAESISLSTEPAQATENTTTTAQSAQTTENTTTTAQPIQTTENTTTTAQPTQTTENPPDDSPNYNLPTYGAYYYDLTNVVLYIELYDELPPNYITKAQARELGWEGGSVENYKAGAAIGGDYFGNYEGLLPEANGRSYTECDIDTNGYSSRGSRRLVFSNDGLYFYTSDHYESFSEVTVTEDYEVIR